LSSAARHVLPNPITRSLDQAARYDRFQLHQYAVQCFSREKLDVSPPALPALPEPCVTHPTLKDLYSEAQLHSYAHQYLSLSGPVLAETSSTDSLQALVDYVRLLEAGVAASAKARLKGDRYGVRFQAMENSLLVLTKSAALTALIACRTPTELATAIRLAGRAEKPLLPRARPTLEVMASGTNPVLSLKFPPEVDVATAERLALFAAGDTFAKMLSAVRDSAEPRHTASLSFDYFSVTNKKALGLEFASDVDVADFLSVLSDTTSPTLEPGSFSSYPRSASSLANIYWDVSFRNYGLTIGVRNKRSIEVAIYNDAALADDRRNGIPPSSWT
jgi:hypothetical protein